MERPKPQDFGLTEDAIKAKEPLADWLDADVPGGEVSVFIAFTAGFVGTLGFFIYVFPWVLPDGISEIFLGLLLFVFGGFFSFVFYSLCGLMLWCIASLFFVNPILKMYVGRKFFRYRQAKKLYEQKLQELERQKIRNRQNEINVKFNVFLDIINICAEKGGRFFDREALKHSDEYIEECISELIPEMLNDQKKLEALKYAYSEFHGSFIDKSIMRGVTVYETLLSSSSSGDGTDHIDKAAVNALASFSKDFDYSALLAKSSAASAAAIEHFNQMVNEATASSYKPTP